MSDTLSMALSRLQQEEALRVSNIEGLVHCPFCNFAAICDHIDLDKEFRCEGPECGITSCRLCERVSHIPKSCEEASKENNVSKRHAIEEAMTSAIIRTCK